MSKGKRSTHAQASRHAYQNGIRHSRKFHYRACVGEPSDSNDEFVSNKESSATKNMPDLCIHHCL